MILKGSPYLELYNCFGNRAAAIKSAAIHSYSLHAIILDLKLKLFVHSVEPMFVLSAEPKKSGH